MKTVTNRFARVLLLAGLLCGTGCVIKATDPAVDDTSGSFTKSGNITGVETWGNTGGVYKVSSIYIEDGGDVTWGSGISVEVTGTVKVSGNGSLTIEPGVKIEFGADGYVDVGSGSSGTIKANGTSARPITFTRKSGVQYWGYGNSTGYSGGLWFGNYLTYVSQLRNCIIEYATTGLYVTGAKLAIDSCIFRYNQFGGINFASDAAPDTSSRRFTGNRINGNGDYPIRIGAKQMGSIGAGNDFSGNATNRDFVYIADGAIDQSSSVTWRKQTIPYFVDVNVNINDNSELTIEPGVHMYFDADAYMNIGSAGTGSLFADGTQLDSIVFTRKTTGAFWGYGNAGSYSGGLWFNNYATTNSSVSYAVIEYSTSGAYLNADVNIHDCRISNNQSYGLVYTDVLFTQTGNNIFGNGMGSSVVP